MQTQITVRSLVLGKFCYTERPIVAIAVLLSETFINLDDQQHPIGSR
jgi:hypothetical protein